jgi:hypothetical protein
MGKIHQSTIKYTKWPKNRPNGHKIYQHLPMQDTPKFTQNVIFGLKIYHLATLTRSAELIKDNGSQMNQAGKKSPKWHFESADISMASHSAIDTLKPTRGLS